MKREIMTDHTPEIRQELKRFQERKGREDIRAKSFINSAIKEVSDNMARFTVSPTPDAFIAEEEIIKATDEGIAKMLSEKVMTVDPHFQNLSLEKQEDLVDAVALTLGKVKALSNEVGSKAKGVLRKFGEKIVDKAVDEMWSRGGKKAAIRVGTLSLVVTACSSGLSGEVDAGRLYTSTPQERPVATEAVSTPTVLPTTEKGSRGKYGVEGGPAHAVEDPKTYKLEELVTEENWGKIKNEVRIEDLDNGNRLIIYPLPWGCEVQEDGTNSQKFIFLTRELHPDVHDVEVAAICDINPGSPTYGTVPKTNYKKFSLDQLVEEVSLIVTTEQAVELDEEKIEELAQNLDCQGSEGACVYRSYMEGSVQDSTLEAISTGVIRTVDILQPGNNKKIAEAEVAVCVTKDLEGNPQVLNIVVQLRPIETLEVNVYPWVNYLVGNYEGYDDKKPHSIEELREILREGREFGFAFSSKDYEKDVPYTEIMSKVYSDGDYIERLQQFVDNKGHLESTEPLLILPVSMLPDY